MKRDSKLSGVLHILLHLIEVEGDEAVTSEKLAQQMATNPVVVRRIFSGLREAGFVSSVKGHGGGWRIACDPAKTTLADIYKAVGSPAILAIGHRTETPGCLVERAVNAALDDTFREVEAVVMTRFKKITLAALAADFGRRLKERKAKQENKHHAI